MPWEPNTKSPMTSANIWVTASIDLILDSVKSLLPVGDKRSSTRRDADRGQSVGELAGRGEVVGGETVAVRGDDDSHRLCAGGCDRVRCECNDHVVVEGVIAVQVWGL